MINASEGQSSSRPSEGSAADARSLSESERLSNVFGATAGGDEDASKLGLPAWPHACDLHANAPAIAACARCGRLLCQSCRRIEADTAHSRCAACAHRSSTTLASPNASQRPAPLPHARDATTRATEASETRKLGGLLRVLPRLLLEPRAFFAQLQAQGGLFRALLFGVLCTMVGMIAAFAIGPEQPTDTLVELQSEYGFSSQQMLLLQVVALPAGALLEIVLYAALLNLVLRLFRVEDSSLSLALKLASYAMAAKLLLVVPLLGGPLSLLALIALLGLGVNARHQLPLPRALLVAAIPVLLLSMVGLAVVS